LQTLEKREDEFHVGTIAILEVKNTLSGRAFYLGPGALMSTAFLVAPAGVPRKLFPSFNDAPVSRSKPSFDKFAGISSPVSRTH
jgi:hypothetical protein